MGKVKRLLVTASITIAAMLSMTASVNAAQLQEQIEQTINSALDEYLSTVDVKAEVDKVIDDTLGSFIDDLSAAELESQIKQEAGTALMQHLEGVQAALNTSITSSTYDLTNNQVKEYIKNQIVSNIDSKINSYNDNMKLKYRTKYEDDYGTHWEYDRTYYNGQYVYTYEIYTVSDRERYVIKTTVANKLDSILNFGYTISNGVLNDGDALLFSQVATNYISSEIMKYTNTQELLNKVRTDVKITVNDQLKDILASSIETYIKSNSGQAIFTGIKDAIYYYIQQNGGLDKILKDGFGQETAEYVSGQIGQIVKASIQYSLTPYIKELSQGKIKEVTENITQTYVNSGAWSVVANSVQYNLDQILATDGNDTYDLGGDKLQKNLVNLVDSYLASTTRIIDIVNESMKSTSVADNVSDYWYYDSEGYRYQNSYYNDVSNVGQLILKQAREASSTYMANTIFPQVRNSAKVAITNYMNGNGGAEIKQQLVNNINQIFSTDVVEPLLDQINVSVANWISNGIATKITGNLQTIVTEYLKNVKNPEDFSEETGIKLGEILKEVRYNSNPISGQTISLEELIANKTLVGAERGRIVVPKESEYSPLDDATVELGSLLPYKVQVYELSAGNMVIVNPYWTALTAIFRFFPNPYGATIGQAQIGVGVGIAGLSRTLAKYDTTGIKNLEPEEAYVLAHEKNTGYYPDRVQAAYYKVLDDVRGIKAEYDEGIVDKKTYQTIMKVFGYASILSDVDWSSMTDKMKNANSVSDFIRAVDGRIVSALLAASGVNMYDLLPFVDPSVLMIASMMGMNIGNLAGMLQNGLADMVGWVETGGSSFTTDMTGIRGSAVSAWDKMKNNATDIWDKIGGIKEDLTGATQGLEDQRTVLELEMDSKMSEVDTLTNRLNTVDQQLKTATGDTATSLQQTRTQLSSQLSTATTELNQLNTRAVQLAGQYPSTVNNTTTQIKENLGTSLGETNRSEYNAAAEELGTQFTWLEGIGKLESNNTDLSKIVEELGLNASNGQLTEEDLGNIDTSKLQSEVSEVNAALNSSRTAQQSLQLLDGIGTKLNNSVNYFDVGNLVSNPKFASATSDNATLNQFVNLTNSMGVSMTGKNLSTVFSELLREWEKRPDFDSGKALPFMQEVAKEMGVEATSVKMNTILKQKGMTWDEFKAQNGNFLTNSLYTILNNRFLQNSTLLYALQMIMPMPNELTEDYDSEDPMAGYELYEEATNLGIALDHWNEFEQKNGANLVDRTNYNDVKVSYSKDTDSILVGPFTIDYIREFYQPISEYDSEMVDPETGIISYTGIVGAELYSDDAKTVPIQDWEFVYPDKRTSVPTEDSAYEYPYPGEVFYLKFPSEENYSINTLSKMTFKLGKMDADGQTYQLSGGYDQLLWMTSGVPIPCPFIGRCIHGVIGGHALGPYLWCPPVFCPIHGAYSSGYASQMKNTMNGLLSSGAGSAGLGALLSANAAANAADKVTVPPAFPGVHMMGNFYFCFRVTLGSDLHAQNLEQIIYSKIYVEYQTVALELGKVQTYHNNDVNTTDVLYPAENQGNISVETSDVPQLPFLPNYDTYPAWNGYPYYDGNPNYPTDPYYPDNAKYNDYPSWPYYSGDPTYPYYPNNKVIPLTFKIDGTVWLDNPGGTEAEVNGVMDDNERGVPNVEVTLYKVEDPDNYIAKTLTDEDGKYMFEYIRVGFDYYVEFAYDGITYRTTKYLESDMEEYSGNYIEQINNQYKQNPEAYLKSSHAIEDMEERDEFNSKFYEISQNLATAEDGTTIPLEYKTWYTDNGAVSTVITTDKRGITLDDFKMYARTMTTELYFPLDNQYQVDGEDLDLFNDGTDNYIRTYPGLENVNLGLIKREQGDMQIKTDLYQVITTMKEDIQRYPYNEKSTSEDTYDILDRNDGYYTNDPYHQEINPDDDAYRVKTTYVDYTDIVGDILTDSDELHVFMEYKILIKNNATLNSGRVIVLENSFDKDLKYDTQYDWTTLTSWIETPRDGSEETDKEQITWHYREGEENGYRTIYTTDLQNKNIAPGEVVELHLILEVNKNANGGNETDGDGDFKESISEIHTYSYKEGLIDKSSNPGSIVLGDPRTYPDSADPAPLAKVIYDTDYTTGNEITGYVWEDLVEGMLSNNNQFISDGLREKSEPVVDNVKVEIIEVVTDKQTGREVEVLRKTASGTDYYRTGQDITVDGKTLRVDKGQYRFTKLETGIYKVKFTYGDDYQLTRDLTYNAQDYKTLSLDTTIQQYDNKNLEVMILNDTSSAMGINNKDDKIRNATQNMIDKLYEKVQTAKVGAISFSEPGSNNSLSIGLTQKPNKEALKQLFKQDVTNVGGTLESAIKQARSTFGNNADAKVIVILTDGYMKNKEADKKALEEAQAAGIKVVTIACSTDEWDKATFGTENNPTAGNLYNIRELNIPQYVTEVVLEDILLEFEQVLPNLTDAKDIENVYNAPANSKVGEIYSRKRNIDYSSTITNANAEVLDLDNIRATQLKIDEARKNNDTKKAEEFALKKNEQVKNLANNTKVTAITTNRNIVLSHKAERTQEVNLGLVERPKLEVKVQEKVSRIVVTLSNGEVIIDTAKDLNQNVQLIPNEIYSIYMDEEIMQGAKIDVEYKLTITNNGQVDTLADYFTYDMFNPAEVKYMTRTVPIKIGTLNNYYSNLTFRAEDNTNLEVETNSVKLDSLRVNGTAIQNYGSLIEKGKTTTPSISGIETNITTDGRAAVLQETLTWDNKHMIDLNDNVDQKIDSDKVKVVETTSLKSTEIFPNMSKEVFGKAATSSINLYAKYTKNISANDSEDVLTYKNSAEIVQRLNDLGRRDYIAVSGNYLPHDTNITEYDAATAEKIIILPPFGENHSNYYVITIVSIVIIGVGIVFIRKRIL